MAYELTVSPRAQREIENAIEFYALHSADAPVNFISALKDAYATLELSPFFRLRYKNIHALRIKMFPHSLYFVVNEDKQSVRVLSCFHNKQDPNKRPAQ